MLPCEKPLSVRKVGNDIDIYYPCKFSEHFIHYHFCRVDRDSENMHQWRMYSVRLASPEKKELIKLYDQIEWEGAILEKGAKDFIGGYHGDERGVSLSILADTCLMDPQEDFDITCRYLRLSTVSYLDRCDTPGDAVFLRFKDLTFDQNGYTIHNRFELLQDFNIERFESIMMSFPLKIGDQRFITHAASNTHPNPAFISLNPSENRGNPIFSGDAKATTFEVFAPAQHFYARVQGLFDPERYPNGFRVVDNWRVGSDHTFKAYFNLTGRYQAVKGEIIESSAVFTLEG